MTGPAGLNETTLDGVIDTVQTAAVDHNARAAALRKEARGPRGPVAQTILVTHETETAHVALRSAGRAPMGHGSSVGSVPLQSQSRFFPRLMTTLNRRCWTAWQGAS